MTRYVAGVRTFPLATTQLTTGVRCKVSVVVRVADLPAEALIFRGQRDLRVLASWASPSRRLSGCFFGGLFGPGGEAVEMEGSPADLTVPDPVRGTDHIPADHAVISRVSQTNCQSFHESTIFFDLVHKGSRCARPI